MQLFVSSSNLGRKISTLGSRDIIGHAAVRLPIHGFLYMVNYNHMVSLAWLSRSKD